MSVFWLCCCRTCCSSLLILVGGITLSLTTEQTRNFKLILPTNHAFASCGCSAINSSRQCVRIWILHYYIGSRRRNILCIVKSMNWKISVFIFRSGAFAIKFYVKVESPLIKVKQGWCLAIVIKGSRKRLSSVGMRELKEQNSNELKFRAIWYNLCQFESIWTDERSTPKPCYERYRGLNPTTASYQIMIRDQPMAHRIDTPELILLLRISYTMPSTGFSISPASLSHFSRQDAFVSTAIQPGLARTAIDQTLAISNPKRPPPYPHDIAIAWNHWVSWPHLS